MTHQEVPALLDRWASAGIITAEQADRMRADYTTITVKRPVSLVAEGLGYLGGVIVVIGLVLVLGLSWQDLTTKGRIGVAGGIAAALIIAGAMIPAGRLGPAGTRLRGVLWAAATVPVFGGAHLCGLDLLHWEDRGERVLLLGAGVTAAVSAVLWVVNRHALQQLSTVVWLSVAAFAAAQLPSQSWFRSSLAVWGVGVVWFLLSLPNIIPQPARMLGALGAIVGAMMLLGFGEGPLIALGTVLALVVIAVLRRELALLGISSVGTLIVLPFVVEQYLPGGALSTALALVAGGLALIATGVYTARRRHEPA